MNWFVRSYKTARSAVFESGQTDGSVRCFFREIRKIREIRIQMVFSSGKFEEGVENRILDVSIN